MHVWTSRAVSRNRVRLVRTKKREILAPSSHPSGPHPSGPHPSGPHFSGFWEPHRSGPTLRGVLLCFFCILLFFFFFSEKEGQKTETPILAKVGLAKVGLATVGQIRMAKVGLANFGLSPFIAAQMTPKSHRALAHVRRQWRVSLVDVDVKVFPQLQFQHKYTSQSCFEWEIEKMQSGAHTENSCQHVSHTPKLPAPPAGTTPTSDCSRQGKIMSKVNVPSPPSRTKM